MYDEEDDVTTGNENTNSGGTDNNDDIAPVHFSKWKVAIIIVFLVVVILMCTAVIRGLKIQKVQNSGDSQNTKKVEQSIDTEPTSNIGEKELPDAKNSSDSGDVKFSSAENSKVSEKSNTDNQENEEGHSEGVEVPELDIHKDTSSEQVQKAQSSGLNEIANEPVLGAEVETKGIVTGMHMYKVNESYIYGVNITIVTGNGESRECCYFCPRKTYNAVQIGDSLSVSYQEDTQGNISVMSISR